MAVPVASPTQDAPPSVASRHATALGLVAMCASFALLAAHYVPRLANVVWGDQEFSGWSAAIARRIAAGEVPYRDFTIVMPTASMSILAVVQRLTGHASILHEAALCAACHLGMGVLAWAMARPFVSRLGALMVGASTLALVIQLPKELAYDHTAQVAAWASVAIVAHALLAEDERARRRLAAAAGLVAGAVLVFKQSTMIGAVLGGTLALAWQAYLDGSLRRGGRGLVAPATFAAAAVVGVAGAIAFLARDGVPLRELLTLLFIDASKVKGGAAAVSASLAQYFVVWPTVAFPLLPGALSILVGIRFLRERRSLSLPDVAPGARGPVTLRALGAFSGVFAAACALGVAMLRLHASAVPTALEVVSLTGRYLPNIGLLAAVGWLIAGWLGRATASRRLRAVGALLLGALTESAFHNASVPWARLFFDNNAIIPVSILCIFLALEEGRAERWRWAIFVVLAFSMTGGKMDRWLAARTRVLGDGFWSGMMVSPRGVEALRAAKRADELAGPHGTALVLPEDMSLAALLATPRPKLCGGILFVDQYPDRCFAHDLAKLESELPDVLVLYPRESDAWRRVYGIWGAQSPAALLNEAVLGYHLERAYELDSSYEAKFGNDDHIDVWVRKDRKPKEPAP